MANEGLQSAKPKLITVRISAPAHATLRYYGLMTGMTHGEVVDRALSLLARESKLDEKIARSIGAFANPAELDRKEKQNAQVKSQLQSLGGQAQGG